MYDRSFFQSKPGKAAMACIAAMCAFVAITTQMQFQPTSLTAHADVSQIANVELA